MEHSNVLTTLNAESYNSYDEMVSVKHPHSKEIIDSSINIQMNKYIQRLLGYLFPY